MRMLFYYFLFFFFFGDSKYQVQSLPPNLHTYLYVCICNVHEKSWSSNHKLLIEVSIIVQYYSQMMAQHAIKRNIVLQN